jgi:hypothetical protein
MKGRRTLSSSNSFNAPNRKLSAAASVVAQTLSRAEGRKSRNPFVQARVENNINPKTGAPALIAIFPSSKGEIPNRNDISFLLDFPSLKPMFEYAFIMAGATLAPSSRSEMFRTIRRGFLAYLRDFKLEHIHPSDIGDEVLVGFREWLLNPSSGKPLHPKTVGKALGVVRTSLEAVEDGQWVAEARRIAERVPFGVVGVRRSLQPTEVLSLDSLLQIMYSAEKEVLEIQARWDRGRQLIGEGRERLASPIRQLQNTMNDYADLAICLAEIDSIFPNIVPDLDSIAKENKRLANAIVHIHTQRKVSSFFQPTPRDLVPFVILLTICTVFNPDTVLTLEWSCINRNLDRAGTPAVEIVGVKGRASSDLVRLLDPASSVSQSLSLHRLLDCLNEICARIRPMVNKEHKDRVFIYVPEGRSKSPCSFGSYRGGNDVASGDITWRYNLKRFIDTNQLSHFSLGQLRPTIIDMVQMIDGGLEAARKVGNHRNPTTTWTHYTSSGVRNRYREKIGQIILLRERWITSGGAIDPRRLERVQDMGAATPGFICFDPFDSPRPNQQPGRLCADYGACPGCPLGGARPYDPTSVAYYSALEQAIFKSQPNMNAKTWLERWAPILADLRALLRLVSKDVLEESEKIRITLPLVG